MTYDLSKLADRERMAIDALVKGGPANMQAFLMVVSEELEKLGASRVDWSRDDSSSVIWRLTFQCRAETFEVWMRYVEQPNLALGPLVQLLFRGPLRPGLEVTAEAPMLSAFPTLVAKFVWLNAV